MTESEWMRTAEARNALNVSISTLRRWDKAGHIRTHRTPTGQRRYWRADIERIIAMPSEPEKDVNQ